MEPSSPSPKSIAAAESPTGPYRGRNDEFPYSPLDQSRNEVRLLQLGSHAGDKDNEDVLPYCSLRVVSLDENPTYEALSYTWGDASDLRYIILDLHLFLDTRNLEPAIRQLRKRSTSDLLWVDAICIYVYRHRKKPLRNLRLGPPISEGFFFQDGLVNRLLLAFATPCLFLVSIYVSLL
jgi:hypothetical protein